MIMCYNRLLQIWIFCYMTCDYKTLALHQRRLKIINVLLNCEVVNEMWSSCVKEAHGLIHRVGEVKPAYTASIVT